MEQRRSTMKMHFVCGDDVKASIHPAIFHRSKIGCHDEDEDDEDEGLNNSFCLHQIWWSIWHNVDFYTSTTRLLCCPVSLKLLQRSKIQRHPTWGSSAEVKPDFTFSFQLLRNRLARVSEHAQHLRLLLSTCLLISHFLGSSRQKKVFHYNKKMFNESN